MDPGVNNPLSGLLCDILWSDPDAKTLGWAPNDRGVSHVFGADVLAQFLQKMDIDIVVSPSGNYGALWP